MLIDWFTVAAQAVNFLILVWILHRFVFRPILKAAAKREQRIADMLAEAHRAREQTSAERERMRRGRLELERARDDALARADAEAQQRLDTALAKVDRLAEERRSQWEQSLERRSDELARDIRALVGRQAVDIARRAVLDMAGQSLEDRLADSLARHMDTVRRELALTGGGRIHIRAPRGLSPEAAGHLQDALAQAFPGTEVDMGVDGQGPGLVLAAGGRRLEWTLERYFKGLEEDIETVLQTHGSRQ